MKVVVADDALTRKNLVSLLADEQDFPVAAECGDGVETIHAVAREKPELLILNVHMPDRDGFEVIETVRSMNARPVPVVILTTTCDRDAVRAYENGAIDCLLKPLARERFRKSIARVRNHFQFLAQHALHRTELAETGRNPRRANRLIIRSSGRYIFLAAEDIRWIQSEGNYLRINLDSGSHLIRESMQRIEQRLDPSQFLRIHRCAIVNLRFVKEIRSSMKDGAVVLNDATRLGLSRGCWARIEEFLLRESIG